MSWWNLNKPQIWLPAIFPALGSICFPCHFCPSAVRFSKATLPFIGLFFSCLMSSHLHSLSSSTLLSLPTCLSDLCFPVCYIVCRSSIKLSSYFLPSWALFLWLLDTDANILLLTSFLQEEKYLWTFYTITSDQSTAPESLTTTYVTKSIAAIFGILIIRELDCMHVSNMIPLK